MLPDNQQDFRALLEQSPPVKAVMDALARAPEPQVYLVGGAVRDLLQGVAPIDIDLCVEGPIEPVIEMLGDEAELHERFETATILRDGFRWDVARCRRETYPKPGGLPNVAPADIATDLRRRDFTVNAIALALAPGRAGEMVSALDALEHLKLRRLEILHASSFRDDPTRLLRLARYSARLRFAPGEFTRLAAEAAIAAGAIGTVSGARIGNELRLLAAEPDPVGAFSQLAELGIDRAIDPLFGLGPEHSEHAAVAQEALALLPADGRRDLLVIAASVLNLSPTRVRRLLDELAFSAGDRHTIVDAATGSLQLSRALGPLARPSQIDCEVGDASLVKVALAGALGARQQAWEWLERLRHLHLQIDGSDLLDAGIGQGVPVGAGLAAARAAMLDGVAADRARQLAIAVDAARSV